ncbi:MAG: host specificity protein [Acidobacteriota bacterium]
MKRGWRLGIMGTAMGLSLAAPVADLAAQAPRDHAALSLWREGKPAFGVFVPNENVPARPPAAPGGASGAAGGRGAQPAGSGGQPARPAPLYTRAGGERLAANPLYDFVFLNLEGRYDGAAVKAIADGLRGEKGATRKTLIVRIPPFHTDPDAARTRVREIMAAGGDGVTFPHVESVGEARRILALFSDDRINVWSPSNPKGDKLLMLMIEDPEALTETTAFSTLGGYSILACGIGSLTQAFGGDRVKAEAGTQLILAATKHAGLVNMLTASTQDVETRVKEGFLGILAQGQNADEAIRLGRAVSGR